MSEAQPVHIANLTIQHYPKTAEGQAMVSSQEVFCLDGKMYQGYKGAIANVDEKVLLDAELEAVHDVDGTKERVYGNRKSRLGSARYRRDEELQKRENVKSEQVLKDLQLLKLQKEMRALDTVDDVVASGLLNQAKDPQGVHAAVACPECDKVSPPGHKNPAMWLNGHSLHHRKKSKTK